MDEYSSSLRSPICLRSLLVRGDHLQHRSRTLLCPQVANDTKIPASGGADRDSTRTSPPYNPSNEQEPPLEDRPGIGLLRVLEEGRVDRTGRIVDGDEYHPLTRADRRCLRCDLDSGDQYILAGPAAE